MLSVKGSEEGSSSTSGSCSPTVTVAEQAYVHKTKYLVVTPQAFIYKYRPKTSDKPPREYDTTTDGVESRLTEEIGDEPPEENIGSTNGYVNS